MCNLWYYVQSFTAYRPIFDTYAAKFCQYGLNGRCNLRIWKR